MKKILLVFSMFLIFGLAGCTMEGGEASSIQGIEIINELDTRVVYLGEKLQLSAKIYPEHFDQNVKWSSSDEKIATVTRGVVKGIKEGKVTITAAAKNADTVKATLELTIEKNDNPGTTQDWASTSYANHQQYVDVDDTTPLKVKGVVTQLIDNGETINYFLQDGTSGYYIYGQSASLGTIEEGKTYEVGGYKKNKPTKHQKVPQGYAKR
jgi:hypothetical protein